MDGEFRKKKFWFDETSCTDYNLSEEQKNEYMSGEVINLSSQGSFGEIYETSLDNRVIKKVMIKSTTGILGILELYILSGLKHVNLLDANLISIRKYDTIFMLPKAICDFTKLQRISNIQMNDWFFQICQGVLELHKRNILHGDIKPSNILLFETNGVRYPKICDFGLSVYLKNENIKFKFYTPIYRPPEIWFEKASLKSDIWALGATMYELYYGTKLLQCLVHDEKMCQKMCQKMIKEIPNNKNLIIPSDLNKLLNKMLSIDQNERYCIYELLLSDYFKDFEKIDYDEQQISDINFDDFPSNLTTDYDVINLAKNISNKHKIISSVQHSPDVYISIANKIIYNNCIYPSPAGIPYNIKTSELIVIKELNYNPF